MLIRMLIVFGLALQVAGCQTDSPPICKDPPGTPKEIAASPRADGYLEQLALQFSEGVVADAEIYNRLVHDVTAIRTLNPKMNEIGRLRDERIGHTLIVALDEVGVKRARKPNMTCIILLPVSMEA